MAVGAKFGAVMRNPEPGVIECGARPGCRSVAGVAGRRETSRDVIRTGGGLIHRLVTTVAGGCGQAKISAHVTQSAGSGRVYAGQRPTRFGVVKNGARPRSRAVARVTRGREPGRGGIGGSGGIVVGQVAVDTGSARQAVVVVGVALCTLQAGVRAGQGETGGRMVERGASPAGDHRMTQSAILGESGRLVPRIGGAVVVGQVAIDACRAGQTEIAADMALCALHARMGANKGEARGRMIERGACPPGDSGMAGIAGGWES